MRYKKTKEFFEYIISKYGLKRRQLSEIMDVSMTTVHYFLVGYSTPKKEALKRLADYLKEEPEVFEALAYDFDQKVYSGGKPIYPKTREEILKQCCSKGSSVEIVNTDGVHDFELLLCGYTFMLIDDIKRFDTLKSVEVVKKDLCLQAIQELELNGEKRKEMFLITGRWFASKEGYFVFENAPFENRPIRFFYDWKEAMSYIKPFKVENEEEENLLKSYRKLPKAQRSQVQQTIKEKLIYVTFTSETERQS